LQILKKFLDHPNVGCSKDYIKIIDKKTQICWTKQATADNKRWRSAHRFNT